LNDNELQDEFDDDELQDEFDDDELHGGLHDGLHDKSQDELHFIKSHFAISNSSV